MPSSYYNIARASGTAEMAGTISIVFPAFNSLPQKTLDIATRKLEGFDRLNYISGLSDIPLITSNRLLAQDTAQFSVNDSSGSLYSELSPYYDAIENSTLVTREYLKTSREVFEPEITLSGYLVQMDYSERDKQIIFGGIADTSRQNIYVGGRVLSQRFCAAIFNKNGVNDPRYDACGWIPALGGNALTCTHKKEGTDGCIDHGNEPRYFAIEGYSTGDITITTGGLGGWDYGDDGFRPPCFIPTTKIWMADGSTKPIYKIEKGDVVMSFDYLGKLHKMPVDDIMSKVVPSRLDMDFGKGRKLSVTFRHPISCGTDKFKCAEYFETGDFAMSVDPKKLDKWKKIMVWGNHYKEELVRVHNFHVPKTNTYFVEVGDVMVGVHNMKPPVLMM